jgi:glycerol-3-phosphate dehydrogenase
MPQPKELSAEIAIVGGGIAGLWLLNVLLAEGYDAVLCEQSALGDGQTIASQGMVHGGLKYALGGKLTTAADVIAGMPERWRRCLAGAGDRRGDVDLRGVPLLSDRYYLWSDASALGRLGGFLASKVLRGRVARLERSAFPAAFASAAFRGVVYEIGDLVLDVRALLAHLAGQDRCRGRIWLCPVTAGNIAFDGSRIRVACGNRPLVAEQLILAAGAGNEGLLQHWPFDAPRMQRRPLHQVMVRDIEHPPLYAHWIGNLTRPEPRLTITSHPQRDGRWCWYLGGQLATAGVTRDSHEQIRAARSELAEALPWCDFSGARFEAVRIDRAEPLQALGQRPDHAFVRASGPALVCWPTKLSLVPDLADQVLAALGRAGREGAARSPATPRQGLPEPAVATPFWER